MAARQHGARIGGIEQKGRLAIGGGVEVGGHADREVGAEAAPGELLRGDTDLTERQVAAVDQERRVRRMPELRGQHRARNVGRAVHRRHQALDGAFQGLP